MKNALINILKWIRAGIVSFFFALATLVSALLGYQSGYRFEIYLDQNEEYRWRLKAGNNRIVADSGEGYHNQHDCIQATYLVRKKGTFGVLCFEKRTS